MAMNLSNMSSVLKTRYLGQIREQLNNAKVLMAKIGRQDQQVSGKDFTVPMHTTRNTSAGTGLGDGDTLPTAGQQGYTTTIVPNKYLYGRIEVTGPTIAASRDNVGAFVEALNSEVEGLQRDFERVFNRQLNGDGSGALAYWTDTDNATPSVVDDSLGNPFHHLHVGAATYDIVDVSLNNGTFISEDVILTPGAASATNVAVSWTSGALGATIADGDYLINANTFAKELMGIAGIVDNGDVLFSTNSSTSLQGLPVASNQFWRAQAFGSYTSLVPIAFEDIQEMIDTIATQSDYDEDDIDFLFSNYGVRRAYYKLCIAERRAVNTMELDGGFSAVEFNGLPWVVDSQAKRNTLFAIVTDTMKIFRTSDFDWMEKDGSYLNRVANKDAYEATLFHYGNLACLSRNGNGVLKGILES